MPCLSRRPITGFTSGTAEFGAHHHRGADNSRLHASFKTNPANWGKPIQIFGFADYERSFGGFLHSRDYENVGSVNVADTSSSLGDMADAVNQFFLNGATTAYVVGLLPQSGQSLLQASPPVSNVQAASIILTEGSAPTPVVAFTALEITDDDYMLTLIVTPIVPPSQSPPASATSADAGGRKGPQREASLQPNRIRASALGQRRRSSICARASGSPQQADQPPAR
jgi:hypothetical protein